MYSSNEEIFNLILCLLPFWGNYFHSTPTHIYIYISVRLRIKSTTIKQIMNIPVARVSSAAAVAASLAWPWCSSPWRADLPPRASA